MPEKNFLPDLVKEIHEAVQEIKICTTRIETKQDMEIKRTDKHDRDIDNLKLWKNINTTISGALAAAATYFGIK